MTDEELITVFEAPLNPLGDGNVQLLSMMISVILQIIEMRIESSTIIQVYANALSTTYKEIRASYLDACRQYVRAVGGSI
jgi:hypothetical protein